MQKVVYKRRVSKYNISTIAATEKKYKNAATLSRSSYGKIQKMPSL